MHRFLLPFFSMVLLSAWAQPPQAAANPAQIQFDAKWWSKTSPDEHMGFLNGADDCLTWTAHEIWVNNKNGFEGTGQQMNDAITKFYVDHPGSRQLNVIAVWKNVIMQSKLKPDPNSKYAETWTNPHWYLDGFWWKDSSQDEKLGFVEGYLWCMRTHVHDAQETYSKSASFYVGEIDTFTQANRDAKTNREKVASILRRYKDKKPSTTHK